MWYVDTSAFMKLLAAEPESPALRAWMTVHGPCWSSLLLRTEAMRAATRLGIAEPVVENALDTINLVSPAPETFLAAGRLEPASMRALDALHLAAALELGGELDGIVTYDARMAEGARAASIAVISPA